MKTAAKITVRQGDILSTDCDVIALKYAQAFYGADKAVAGRLLEYGTAPESLSPADGSHVLVRSKGAVQARDILFVGTPSMESFSYPDIRRLSAAVLRILKKERPRTTSLAMTVHGLGIALDEIECIQQQLSGYRDSFDRGDFPEDLQNIVIVDRDADRVETIEQVVSACAFDNEDRLPEKDKIFVAMPFTKEMRDIWTFGIQQPVRNLGLLCERLDEEAFLGDILTQIRRRIEKASLVIADLTGYNPNVFLEVGYAWGKGRPTLLLFRKTRRGRNEEKLPFDVGGQRCIFYEDATHLQEQLTNELTKLSSGE